MIESLLLNPGGDLDERLDNPGRRRRRRKNKSVRRTRRSARGRRKNRGNFGRRMAALRRAKRGGSRRRRNSWKGSSRRHAKAARKGWRRKSRRRRNTGRRYSISRGRRYARKGRRYGRRRNPRGVVLGGGSGGMGELWTGPFKIVNFKEPTGILSGVISASIVGLTAASSMVATNIIVNGVDPLMSSLTPTTRAWIKPWLYTAMSGVMGFAAKKFGQAFFKGDSRKVTIITIAAAVPPALQAVGALLKAALPNADWGPFQPIYNAATGLSGDDDGMDDYLQVDGSDADGSASDGGMQDYLQMGEMHEAGMGEMYEAGLGYNYDQEEVESAAAPF